MASGINQQTAEKSLIAEYAALKAHAEKAEAENAELLKACQDKNALYEECADEVEKAEAERDQAVAKLAIVAEAYEEVSTRASILASQQFERNRDLCAGLIREINKGDAATKDLDTAATSLLSEVEALRKNQRTPGTVEICPQCKRDVGNLHPIDKDSCPGWINPFGDKPCPLKAIRTAAGGAEE